MSSRWWKAILQQHNIQNTEERSKLLARIQQPKTWRELIPEELDLKYKEIYTQLSVQNCYQKHLFTHDISRTFSVFGDFPPQTRQLYQHQLRLILNAFSQVYPHSYYQGLNYVVGFFLVHGYDAISSFSCIMYLFQLHQLIILLHARFTAFITRFQQYFTQELPQLAGHFEAIHYHPFLYTVEWFRTLFCSCTSPQLTLAIMDLVFLDFQDILFRVAAAILKVLEDELLTATFDQIILNFRSWVKSADAYQVIVTALALPATHDFHHRLCQRYILKMKCWGQQHTTLASSLVKTIEGGRIKRLEVQLRAKRSRVLATEILHYAIWYNSIEVADYVIQTLHANIDAVDFYGATALHFAITVKRAEAVRLLLTWGASTATSSYLPSPVELDTSAHIRLILAGYVCLYCNARNRLRQKMNQCRSCLNRYCSTRKCMADHSCYKSQSLSQSYQASLQEYREPNLPFVNEQQWICADEKCGNIFSLWTSKTTCWVCSRVYCKSHFTKCIKSHQGTP